MTRHFTARMRSSKGQSLVETAIMLPLLLILVLNVVNLAYFFFVAVNLMGASRTSALYAIQGSYTPFASTQAAAGFPTGGSGSCSSSPNTVTCLAFQDLTGALWNPSAATVRVCSNSNTDSSGVGTSGTGATQTSLCETCTSSGCGAPAAGTPLPPSDPEASNFVANQVMIAYQFSPLVGGTIFNVALQAIPTCNANTCTFVRTATMRSMGP